MGDEEVGAEEPFSFRASPAGDVTVFWAGRAVTVLRKKAATRFLDRIAHCDAPGVQLELAKVTGNFKRGNERTARAREKGKG